MLVLTPAVFPLGMSVQNNGFVNFGNLSPGEGEYITFGSTYPETIVSFSASSGSAADLYIRADDFVGPTAMPLSSLRFKVTYAEITAPSYVNVTSLFLVPNQIPIVSVVNDTGWSSFITSGTTMHLYNDPTAVGANCNYGAKFIWGLRLPRTQQAGTYFSNIWFTLTGN